MKLLKLSFATLLFTLMLCACHHTDGIDNDNNSLINYPIQQELETAYAVLDWASLTSEQRKQYPSKSFVINSYEEYPEENLMGLEEIKAMNIDFQRYTLLLSYVRIPGVVVSHRYVWRKNRLEDVFELFMDFGVERNGQGEKQDGKIDSDGNSEPEDLITYYCTALLVNKIPDGSEVVFWRSSFDL